MSKTSTDLIRHALNGPTMGTRWSALFFTPPGFDVRPVQAALQEAVDAVDAHMSTWKPDSETLGTSFHFAPGEALHIPFVAGHYVKNGADDVSISMSIIFNTRDTAHRIRALLFNQRVRPAMTSLGLSPAPVGRHAFVDALKSQTYRAASWLARSMGKGE